MKLVKACKLRQKNGRCKAGGYCSFYPNSVLVCHVEPSNPAPKKRRGKK